MLAVTIVPLNGFLDQTRFELTNQFNEVRLQLDKALPDEILVKLQSNGSKSGQKVEILSKKFDLSPRAVSNSGIIRFSVTKDTLAKTIEKLNLDPDVEYAEPNYKAQAYSVPNDPYFAYQWNFQKDKLNLPEIHGISTGKGAVVAVIDSGVAYENYLNYRQAPDLSGTRFVSGYDFIENDNHPNDDNGHGTHVTGTIAQSTNNSSGVAGLAPDASIMPVKVLDKNGGGNYFAVAEGIRWAADNGANIINLSLGGQVSSKTLESAVKYATEQRVLIVAASGNDGNRTISFPAAYNNYVLSVGAVDRLNRVTTYSNNGQGLDLVAYGGDLQSDTNRDGYKDGILQQTFSGSPTNFGYFFFQGTSMATPHVAASAALLIEKGIKDPWALTQNLFASATDLGAKGYDSNSGYGLVNPLAALKTLVQVKQAIVPQIIESENNPVSEQQTSKEPINADQPVKHLKISAFTLEIEANFLRNYGKAIILITDNEGNGVSDVEISGTWSGSVRDKASGVTDKTGKVILTSRPSLRRYSEFTYTIESVSRKDSETNWIFDTSGKQEQTIKSNSFNLNLFSL